jgi:hypothetical protein
MALIEGLAQRLEQEGLGFYQPYVAGGTIYVNDKPPTPDAVIVLAETGGLPDLDTFDAGNERPTVQVLVRQARDAYTAPALIQNIYDALHRYSGTLPDGTIVTEARAIQPPFSLGEDANGRAEYVFNLQLIVEVTRPNLA